MIINFYFKDCKKYIQLGDFSLDFKEGTYEVTDPENPELIEKKE